MILLVCLKGGGGRPLLLRLPEDEGGGGESPGGGGQARGLSLPPQVSRVCQVLPSHHDFIHKGNSGRPSIFLRDEARLRAREEINSFSPREYLFTE